ncbi:hypothetical protein HHO41_14640 [Bacillus sp. DNRA2]|uniref:hypothetical protein n=1 Tax=Bacillus sp. DNRA2 TaxID=2723053 RepID=UPI00145F4B79|nr:hypothetical protein [Bacillus sp. DNRA2]NMD71538.1 hypothetical protein [Bacillus sp. DNRA2]
MLKDCVEEDFYEIKMVTCGRLKPNSIPGFFWATFIFSGLYTAVMSFGTGYSSYVTNPIWPIIVKISTALLVIQLIVAIVFTKEEISYRFQKFQSILLTVISLKFSLEGYVLFYQFCEDRQAPSYLTSITTLLVIGGIIYLVYSTIRGIKRVKRGEFRKGGKGLYNFAQSKGQISLPIIFGVTMIAGTIIRSLSDPSVLFGPLIQLYFFLFLFVVLQYAIAFAWPEFFLFTYCKFRFESFIIPMPKRPLEDKYTAKRRKPQKKQTVLVNSHNNHKKKQKQKKARG